MMTSNFGTQTFKVGTVEIVRILEMEFPLGPELLAIGSDPAELVSQCSWAQPHFVTESGDAVFALTTHGLVSEGKKILIDPCCSFDLRRGNPDIADLAAAMLDEKLPAAGFAPGDVDLVINSHIDGVGWNVRPAQDGWSRTFEKAPSLWTARELDRVHEVENNAAAEIADGESLLPLVESGAVQPVPMNQRITSEVRLRPSPGHTTGNVNIWIESEGQSAVIVADEVLNPMQCADPDWGGADLHPDVSPKLRRALLDECAERNTLMIGTHFGTPGAGRVRRAGDRWMLEAEWPS